MALKGASKGSGGCETCGSRWHVQADCPANKNKKPAAKKNHLVGLPLTPQTPASGSDSFSLSTTQLYEDTNWNEITPPHPHSEPRRPREDLFNTSRTTTFNFGSPTRQATHTFDLYTTTSFMLTECPQPGRLPRPKSPHCEKCDGPSRHMKECHRCGIMLCQACRDNGAMRNCLGQHAAL